MPPLSTHIEYVPDEDGVLYDVDLVNGRESYDVRFLTSEEIIAILNDPSGDYSEEQRENMQRVLTRDQPHLQQKP